MKERVLRNLMTDGMLAVMFGMKIVTIRHWRRFEGMPYVRIPGDHRDAIRYDRRAVLRWAAKHGKKTVEKERARL